MLWSEFLKGLDKLRSDIRAGRALQDEINDFDSILSTFRSLIILQPLPKEELKKPEEMKEYDSPPGDSRMLQVGEVKGYVEPRLTKLIVRPPVLEDGEDALAGEEGDE